MLIKNKKYILLIHSYTLPILSIQFNNLFFSAFYYQLTFIIMHFIGYNIYHIDPDWYFIVYNIYHIDPDLSLIHI